MYDVYWKTSVAIAHILLDLPTTTSEFITIHYIPRTPSLHIPCIYGRSSCAATGLSYLSMKNKMIAYTTANNCTVLATSKRNVVESNNAWSNSTFPFSTESLYCAFGWHVEIQYKECSVETEYHGHWRLINKCQSYCGIHNSRHDRQLSQYCIAVPNPRFATFFGVTHSITTARHNR